MGLSAFLCTAPPCTLIMAAEDRLFREGTLVAVCGLKDLVSDIGEGVADDEGFCDVNGMRAQLLRFERSESVWVAMTFNGIEFKIGTDNLRPLEKDDLPHVDLVIGVKCDEELALQEMLDNLTTKGYCVSQHLIPRKSLEGLRKVSHGLKFTRLPADFEPYYLGRDSKEKHVLIDFDSEDVPLDILDSALAAQDNMFAGLCATLSPYLEDSLGIHIASRTNLMVRMTFQDEEEEAEFPSPGEPTNAERENFVSLMKRKRVCIMQFLGPFTGKLTLLPKGNVEEGDDIEIDAAPGVTVVFLTERFQYSHTCAEGATVTTQSWLLGQRLEFALGDFGGDMEVLGASSVGASPPPGETVAVNGMGVCLGADSKDYTCYWLMFNKAGGDTFVEIPMMRWDVNIYCFTYDMQTAQLQGQSYTKHQGYVDGIEFFDNKFFGVSNSEAGSMDPNQRKCLENTYEALVMGGHDLRSLQREPQHIGVFVGISGSEWGAVPHPMDAAGCGSAEAIISNRCNFSMNLKGPSQTINTACSAGLVAMHTAKLHLKYKDFDPLHAVIGAGINFAYSPGPFVGCCGGGMLSYKGRSFTFDVAADGYGRGEGVSSVYMNLMQYSRDVFALVAGSQANQDGRSASITAPNGPSQEKCIKAAFREASLKPPEVDCFECHGTGTALGDPIEVGAFKRIYNQGGRAHSLLVTTSKTNLGHLEGGAGMAGFIKCCLQVMRGEASPNLHLRECNPHLDSEGFPAQFITEPLTCHYDSAYSGVSSFGFGGTNAHAMAYGKNTTTSRGTAQRDFRKAMRDRIASAPAPDILMLGDDPEEWESNGMPVDEDTIGKLYQVEVFEGGKAIWREVVGTQALKRGERFYLSGTFNSWGMDALEQHPEIPSLHSAEVTVGIMGEELFYIVCDENPDMVYYPTQPRCTRKVVPIAGPEPVACDPEQASWCIVADPRTRVRIEFHLAETTVSVAWIKCREAISS
uniref:Type I polyketide synthase n=1 Tax=Gambierdiscus polynesiensis TaxID=439318 RepID=A0A1S6K7V2_9DINO|nr:type I polyketide synthase [Gambierdiscus polynesiensis]